MEVKEIIHHLRKQEWYFETRKQKKTTYQELSDQLDHIPETPEEIEELIDLLRKDNINLLTHRQLNSKEYRVKSKKKIVLQDYDRKDRLSLFLKPYDHVRILSEDEIENNIKEIRKIEEELTNMFNSSFYRLYYLYQFYDNLTSNNYEDFKLNFNPNFIIAQVLFDKQNHSFQKWFDDQWNLCQLLFEKAQSGLNEESVEIRRKILSNINSLNWKKERTKELIKEFLKEKRFSLFHENKEELYIFLYNYISDKQRECQKLYDRTIEIKRDIIESEMKLVISISLKYSSTQFELRDLIQEGNKGLMEAIDNYSLAGSKSFQRILTKYIREAINDYVFFNSNSLLMPLPKKEVAKKILKTVDKLSQEYMRPPTHEEISEHLSIPSETILKVLGGIKKESSWDQQINQNKTDFYYQTQENPESINSLPKELDEKRKLLEKMKEILTDREEKVLRLLYGYYGINYSYSEISKVFDISEYRIRLIEDMAREKLKTSQQNIKTLGYVIFP